jgi:hypothetical protein
MKDRFEDRDERDLRQSRIILWTIGIATVVLVMVAGVSLAKVANAAWVMLAGGGIILIGALVLGVLANGTLVLFESLRGYLLRRRRP